MQKKATQSAANTVPVPILAALYLQGNDKLIAELLHGCAQSDKASYDITFSNRNKKWSDHLENYAKTYKDNGPIFVAVGLAHLYGKDNLLGLLQEKGFTITRENNHSVIK